MPVTVLNTGLVGQVTNFMLLKHDPEEPLLITQVTTTDATVLIVNMTGRFGGSDGPRFIT